MAHVDVAEDEEEMKTGKQEACRKVHDMRDQAFRIPQQMLELLSMRSFDCRPTSAAPTSHESFSLQHAS